jgi:predicted nuclease of restriction endonuclease-like RecB superfamily
LLSDPPPSRHIQGFYATMLTSNLVRVRQVRQQIVPGYLDADDPTWIEAAERLIGLFRDNVHRSRGELENEIEEIFGDAPAQQIHRGLAKLLEDRCEFAVTADHSPEEVRALVFRLATEHRQRLGAAKFVDDGLSKRQLPQFERLDVLNEAASLQNCDVKAIEHALFADLHASQQLVSFKDISPQRLLQRYNVALAQAVLLRAASVEVVIRRESPQRYRQLLRQIKFHRLMCDVEVVTDGVWRLRLDGPLSLFVSTQRYGLQLALFLPTLLLCSDFELQAELRWGPRRTAKKFCLDAQQGLISHHLDTGSYVPTELEMFAQMFRKKITDWDLGEATELVPLGNHIWVPDFRLVHRQTGQVVYLDILGFWRRASAHRHLERLRRHAPTPFLLAVSDQLNVEEAEVEGLPAELYRFRQMPLAEEVARLATALIEGEKKHPEACKSQGG